jgi:hypothetical protein
MIDTLSFEGGIGRGYLIMAVIPRRADSYRLDVGIP